MRHRTARSGDSLATGLAVSVGSVVLSLGLAARVDGAGRLRVLRAAVLPVSASSLITAALFTFLFAGSDFLFALTPATAVPAAEPAYG